ncbi:MAG: histidine--tRNA ligase [Candidatus Nealsonbacteria bacterium CG09_land_8_20_14_0_10_42_14]|uniref:Histidine--tRNA ligase n=1 Tax=Candidatus Nealsonbacteria bacterium CG09_land_8_20_14_0_10_42_14 TaxID=1974707 RepID=A0A2H0WY16_9BACT|nr:MAG: histidine--tRNA ligase [Candidatus Nealsonbacteria bacterium CG09_land_8_20_14_0_10_42_14]
MMAKKPKFQAPNGMHDILPQDQVFFQKVYGTAQNMANFCGFQRIDTPLIEMAELFSRGIGISTDVVEKQMYTFRTRGGDYLALRPELTAGIARAYMEHGMFNLPQPLKFYSAGPLFRQERPQAGRFRQFHQVNFEVLGEESPVIDAQIIQIYYNLLRELKIKNIIVEINSIGASCCRPYYKKLLTGYFRSRESSLCSDCRRRLRDNPLRILDCKEEKCQPVKAQAPQLVDHLCEECKSHFKEVLEFLDEIEVPYRLNPYLVRGLDYYTKTVFEIFEDTEEGQKIGALAAGGRYDGLVKTLGGKETPACGGAAGVERLIIILKEKIKKEVSPSFKKVFLAQLGQLSKRKSLKLFEEFRRAKIPVAESLGKDSLKTQLRTADKLGATFTLILGQKEALDGTIIIRDMKSGKQETVKLEKVVKEMQRRIKK